MEKNLEESSENIKQATEISFSSNSKRIAKNTVLLYFRQILIMLVSLYTVRVVLNVLGAEDYGIYNVVAGVVTMFSFLSGAMATASQRYFSFNLGKNDTEQLLTTFSVTLQIYIILAVVVFVLAETVGLFFVNHKLVIPSERMVAANWIFQLAIFSFLLTLITTPYMACVIAHENMNVYAYISLVEVALKLGIVFLLKILPYDKLIIYGILLCVVVFINTAIYRLFCHTHYEECKFRFIKNLSLFKEIISYSSWNLLGASVGVVKNQIINIVLNIYFGAVVNAARGIAAQVSYAVSSFANNFCTAMKPQIIKKYAMEQKNECFEFVIRGCKFSYFLIYIFVLPLFFVADLILQLWLKNPPEYSVIFTRLVLIDVVLESFNTLIMVLIHASGKIKLYQFLVASIQLLNLPVSFIILRFGGDAYSVFIVSIVLSLIATIVRIIIAKYKTGFPILLFLKKTILPIFFVTFISTMISILLNKSFDNSFIQSLIFCILCVLIIFICIFLIGLSKDEKKMIKQVVYRRMKK